MLRAIPSVHTNEILVQGDYHEFQSICFAIDQITGAGGASGHKPLPEYAASVSLLLGLTYMIRLASGGYCELSTSPNGIKEGWVAPCGTPEEFIAGRSPQKEPDSIIDDVEDAVVGHSGLDLESFYDMNREDQSKILSALGFDSGRIARFIKAAGTQEQYLFSREENPNITFYNTRLQFRVRYSEGALYAYILRELLSHKEVLLRNICGPAGDLPDRKDASAFEYRRSCCLLRAGSDLALLEFFMEQLFLCLSGVTDPDLLIPAGARTDGNSISSSEDLFSISGSYAELRKKEAPKGFLKNWTDDTLTRAAKLLQVHFDDTAGQVRVFIEDFLRLQ